MSLSTNLPRLGPSNFVDAVLIRLAFSGVLLGGVFGVGCGTRAHAPPAVAANTFVAEDEELAIPIPRLRVSVAETTGAMVAPVPESPSVKLDDDDDFDEMPLVKAPALAELASAETMKRALRWLRWVAPVNDEQQRP